MKKVMSATIVLAVLTGWSLALAKTENYIVQRGDTWGKIGQQFGHAGQEIRRVNGRENENPKKLLAGEVIRIPVIRKIKLTSKKAAEKKPVVKIKKSIVAAPSQEKTASDYRLANSLIVSAMVIFAAIVIAVLARRRKNKQKEKTTTDMNNDPNAKITCTACGEKIMNKNLNRHIRKRCPGRDTSPAAATM